LALCTCMHFEFSPFIHCLFLIIIMKVNCTIFEFFSLIIGGVDHRTFILFCI
ncbi:hypothetical protein T11_16782, partial [Trichinella zimbabwensis]